MESSLYLGTADHQFDWYWEYFKTGWACFLMQKQTHLKRKNCSSYLESEYTSYLYGDKAKEHKEVSLWRDDCVFTKCLLMQTFEKNEDDIGVQYIVEQYNRYCCGNQYDLGTFYCLEGLEVRGL